MITFPDFDSWGNGSQDWHRQNSVIGRLETVFFLVCVCLCASSFTYSDGLWDIAASGPSILSSLRDITSNGWGQLRTTHSVVTIACLWGDRGSWKAFSLVDCVESMKGDQEAQYASWRWVWLMICSKVVNEIKEWALQATCCLGQQKTLHDSKMSLYVPAA